MTQVAKELKASKGTVNDLTNKLNAANDLNATNETKLNDLNAKVTGLESTNKTLTAELNAVKSEKDGLTNKIETLTAEITALERKGGTPTPTPQSTDPSVEDTTPQTKTAGDGANTNG